MSVIQLQMSDIPATRYLRVCLVEMRVQTSVILGKKKGVSDDAPKQNRKQMTSTMLS
jgi:hypothetical protein